MIRTCMIAVVILFSALGVSQADMIEVKGKGFLNGQVVSEEGGTVNFLDANGETHVLDRSDILLWEKESGSTLVSGVHDAKKKGLPFQFEPEVWKNKAEREYKKWMNVLEKKTRKAREFISKPLDRSGADSKANMAAQVTQDLGNAAGGMHSHSKRTQKKLSEAGVGFRTSSDSGEKSRFGSLD